MSWELIFLVAIVLLLVMQSPSIRTFVMAVAGLVLMVAAFNVFIKTTECNNGTCDLQPSWAGFCNPSAGHISNVNGTLQLFRSGSETATATCVDIRIWD